MSDLRSIESDLLAAVRPPAKVRDPREAYQRSAQSRFRAAVDAAVAEGHSFRAIARAAHCTVRHVIDCYEGRRNPPGWLFDALPRCAQVEAVRHTIAALKGETHAA